MLIRAVNDPKFSRRFLYMGILAFGFAIYCLYDGFVGYPARRLKGFADFKSDYKAAFADTHRTNFTLEEFEAVADKEAARTWAQYSHDREIPSRADVTMQFVLAVITTIAGIVLISIPLRRKNRWIELNNLELHTSWGQAFHLDQIESVNKRKWRNKGIAQVTYVDGNRRRQFVLDDMMFMRDPTDEIMLEIERHVGVERITGGPPEPLPGDLPAEPLPDDAPFPYGDGPPVG